MRHPIGLRPAYSAPAPQPSHPVPSAEWAGKRLQAARARRPPRAAMAAPAPHALFGRRNALRSALWCALLAASPMRAADTPAADAASRNSHAKVPLTAGAQPATAPGPSAAGAGTAGNAAGNAADNAEGKTAGKAAAPGTRAAGPGNAQVSPGADSAPGSAAGAAEPAGTAARTLRRTARPPAPLKRLRYSARDGFALRMISEQEVTAEIRNGAGRTLAFTSRTLEPGDWILRPRNLAPGLYTVLLRTGPNLRALRMKIENTERPGGMPEWILEKSADSADNKRMPMAPPRGAESARAPAPGDFHAGLPAPRAPDRMPALARRTAVGPRAE